MSAFIFYALAGAMIALPYISIRLAHWVNREKPAPLEHPEDWGVL